MCTRKVCGIIIAFSILGLEGSHGTTTPIVLWHGIGDTCCEPGSIGGFKSFLEKNIPGVYVLSIQIGKDLVQDKWNSYVMPAKKQIQAVCKMIQEDTNLTSGYHAVGFSQGGLLMRAVAQSCPTPRVLNLVTFGGPHQGVYGYPQCTPDKWYCDIVRRLVNTFVYLYVAQIVYVPLQYWHDPFNADKYAKGSIFLSEVNNQKEFKEAYRDNLVKLNKFVMIQYLKDEIVIPYQSAGFGFYKPGQSNVVQLVNETDLYQSDLLGLKKMDKEGKLVFLTYDGAHMILDYVWIKNNVLKYLT